MRRVLLPHHISADPAPFGAVLRDFAGRSMGTTWSVRLAAAPTTVTSHLQQGLQQQLDSVVAEMSHWEPDSNLGRFNRAPAGSWHPLPPAFFDVLAFALDVARAIQAAPAFGQCRQAISAGGRRALQQHCAGPPATLQAPAAARAALLAQPEAAHGLRQRHQHAIAAQRPAGRVADGAASPRKACVGLRLQL